MKHLFVISYVCICINAFSQNIVPNPGFEQNQNFPIGFSQSFEDFTKCVKHWMVPNTTTPDYVAPFFYKGNRLFGSNHSGLCMIGLAIESNWAECVYAKLEPEMEANTTYLIEFWIKRSVVDFMDTLQGTPSGCPPGYVSPNFGILLSDTIQTVKGKKFIVGTPQLRCGDKFWLDKNWTKVTGYYTSDKSYRYVYVGQFRPEGHSGPLASSGYVLVDDINIRRINISDELAKEAIEIPGAIIPLDQVFFEPDKSVLMENSFGSLDTLVALLSRNDIHVKINGHTDNQGSVEYNQKLSKERAKAVRNYLILKGLDKKRISWEGYGASKPKLDNSTESGRQKNRRVEFEILKK
jgi:outer membrane protein OmpA-like peptidoglycan-associated protein